MIPRAQLSLPRIPDLQGSKTINECCIKMLSVMICFGSIRNLTQPGTCQFTLQENICAAGRELKPRFFSYHMEMQDLGSEADASIEYLTIGDEKEGQERNL